MESNILGERYEIQRKLGKNAGRRTFLVRDIKTQELAVIKLLLFDGDCQWDDLKFFEREAETLKSLSHPAIPHYLDSFEINSPNFKGFALVQTYIKAQSLEQQVKNGRRFTEAEIKQLAKSLLEILIYLHSCQPPVVHRDIKPSNILLTNRSGNSVGDVYLVDFGSVQTLAATEGGTITVVGTYGYMPPEQFGGRTVPASDLYSLGATLIYLIARRHPADLPLKDGQIQFEQVANLSPSLINWLRQMTQPSLDKRFTSAKEAFASEALCSIDLLMPKAFTDQKDPSQLTISKHNDSKIILDKNVNYLDIFIPPEGFGSPWLTIIFLGISGIFLLLNSLAAFQLWLILWTFALLLSVVTTPSLWMYKNLRINQEQIIFTSGVLGLKIINYSAPRQDIVKLVYSRGYYRSNSTRSSGYRSAKLIIWAGVRQFKLYGSNAEMEWLAEELSDWLNLPITRV